MQASRQTGGASEIGSNREDHECKQVQSTGKQASRAHTDRNTDSTQVDRQTKRAEMELCTVEPI